MTNAIASFLAARSRVKGCTYKTCDISESIYGYLPSLVANSVFLALFSFSLICYAIQGFRYRKAWGFTVAVVCGTILEALGYLGRVLMHHDPFDKTAITLQLTGITIAPTFLCAAIYLCLARVLATEYSSNIWKFFNRVIIFGSDISRIPPRRYTRIFIPCDIVSLLIQLGGFMILNNAIRKDTSTKLGNNIVIAGISFQVFALTLFISLSAEYFWRVHQRDSAALNLASAKLRNSTRFTLTIAALVLATLCIFARSIYRLAEFAEGWMAAPNRNQGLFIGLESTLVTIATFALNAFHPGVCFRDDFGHEDEKNGSSDDTSA